MSKSSGGRESEEKGASTDSKGIEARTEKQERNSNNRDPKSEQQEQQHTSTGAGAQHQQQQEQKEENNGPEEPEQKQERRSSRLGLKMPKSALGQAYAEAKRNCVEVQSRVSPARYVST